MSDVRRPTSFSYPLTGAILKRNTNSAESMAAPQSESDNIPLLPTTAQVSNSLAYIYIYIYVINRGGKTHCRKKTKQ